jgi:PKHD-type hydroxylase
MHRFTAQTLRAFVPEIDRPYEAAMCFERVFTPRQCGRIVASAEDLAVEEGLVGTDDASYDRDAAIRRSRLSWIEPVDATLWIFDKLTKVVAKANRTYGFDLLGFTEDLQLTRYDEPGAFYGWHQDGLEGDLAGRKLSLVTQLTDPDTYEGSDLELFCVNEEYEADAARDWAARARRQGSVVVFPAFEYHRVTPLVAGARHSLVCWIGGPPFR